MTTTVKNIIIGFGKAGKTLAGYLGSIGEDTILIEKSKEMYGGTCINVGCIPSKKISNKKHFASNIQTKTLAATIQRAFKKRKH